MPVLAVDEVALREPRLLVPGRQPLGLVNIASSSISKDICFAWIASRPNSSVHVPCVKALLTSAVIETVGHNRAAKISRATSAGISFGTIQPLKGSSWTIVIRANPASASDRYALFSQRTSNAGSGYTQLDVIANSSSGLDANSGTLNFYFRNTAGEGFWTYTGNTAVDGAMNTFAITKQQDPNFALIYKNGVELSVTNGGGTPNGTYTAADQETKIGNIGAYTTDEAFAAIAHIEYLLLFNRALSAIEIQSLAKDPYQLLTVA